MCSPVRPRGATLALVVLAALMLVACNGAIDVEDEPTPTPTPVEPTPSPTPTPAPASTPAPTLEPVAGDPSTAEQERDAEREEGVLAVTDVRVATHGELDRLVLEVEGDGGEPGWTIRYTDEARTAGRGDEIELEGDAVLQIAVHGMTLPPELPADIQPWPQERMDGPADSVVREVVADTIFEGTQSFYVGLDAELPYVVELLDDPQRIVVDVMHTD